jgi:hypothetical protein
MRAWIGAKWRRGGPGAWRGPRPPLRVAAETRGDGRPAPEGEAARPWRGIVDAAGGWPTTHFRINGWQLELRIWFDAPPPSAGAIRHPSGVWYALRVL